MRRESRGDSGPALAEQVRSQSDGEHCSTFRCGGQRNELHSRADARLTCGRVIALSRQDSPFSIHRITASTGWARRASAKAPSSLQQSGEHAQKRHARRAAGVFLDELSCTSERSLLQNRHAYDAKEREDQKGKRRMPWTENKPTSALEDRAASPCVRWSCDPRRLPGLRWTCANHAA